MERLDHLSDKDLTVFFRRNKTAMSCMEEPGMFLNQLRDHDLIPEKQVKKVTKMESKEKIQAEVYQILESLEKSKRQMCMKQFWRSVLQDHILQKYPTLRTLKSDLEGLKSNQDPQGAEKVKKKNVATKKKRAAETMMSEYSAISFPDAEKPSKKKKQIQKPELKTNTKKKKTVEEGKMKKKSGPASISSFFQVPDIPVTDLSRFFYSVPEAEKLIKKKKLVQKREKKVGTNKKKSGEDSKRKEKPGSPSLSTQIQSSPATNSSFFLGSQDISDPQLQVICGDKVGTLFKDRLSRGQKCIQVQDTWYTPSGFEKFAGNERNKNWKASIRWQNIPLQKLIKDGLLQIPPPKRRRAQTSQDAQLPLNFPEGSSSLCNEKIQNLVWKQAEARIQKQKVTKDIKLPVSDIQTWGTYTEQDQFPPVKPELTQSHFQWTTDTKPNVTAFNQLIKQDQDVKCELCFICNSVSLVHDVMACCAACLRYFHKQCHLPTLQDQTVGNDWMCTFCVWKANQGLWPKITKEKALNSLVSGNIMHCEYLLLCMYKEDVLKIFTKNHNIEVEGHSKMSSSPMCLDQVKTKLQSRGYKTVSEFVNDIQKIFHCKTNLYMVDSSKKMGIKLSQNFVQEFHKVFKIQ